MSNLMTRWSVVSREELLDVLLEESIDSSEKHIRFPDSAIREGKLALGYFGESKSKVSDTPTLLVIGDQHLNDILAWLRVYAGEAVPLSQYLRVVLRSDYDKFEYIEEEMWPHKHASSRWACVAVGESLGQADGEMDLQNMALSRLSSSFTLPVARTTIHSRRVNCTRICIDRLRVIGSDRRFVRRAVGVDQLLTIWSIAGADIATGMSAEEAAHLVVSVVEKSLSSEPRSPLSIKDFAGLRSDSIEERVIAFNRLSSEFLENQLANYSDSFASILAAAAFLVGRGTSHVFLLKRFSKIAPTVFAWFGVMAALSGIRSWDAAWLRAVKGAERLIRPNFYLGDISQADISWPEFTWMVKAFDGLEQLISLPKMLPRTLAVEVVPGALLHVRIGGGSTELDNRTLAEPSAREQLLQNSLNQFIHLAQKVRGAIELPPLPLDAQRSLELNVDQTSTAKQVRSRRTKKDSSSRK